MNWIDDLISLMRPLTPESLAVKELQIARSELLAAQTAREYAAAMVRYNEDRVSRLTRTVVSMGAV